MRRTPRGMVIAGSIILGAVGAVVGWWAGLALVSEEAAGWMTRSATVSALVGGSIGLVIGTILGGTAGWAFMKWRERERYATSSSLPPSEHSPST